MSINGDKRIIPGLDYLFIAVKRSELPAVARFDYVRSACKKVWDKSLKPFLLSAEFNGEIVLRPLTIYSPNEHESGILKVYGT